ncbi:shikimate dehydrogenase [Chromobacterium amazonense]|uniref:Shikimate dehydrogenase (NADP(+)) n=1 Tax=Chromobacterium amazonense TaxID=1382803 RepID=A0A1S1XEP6_9NEIS|nr:shikimate dehydrogenase [Chromobacterium amazonense]KIA82113.1 shikimate dehydrogenase [Chromobacterium piscinae]MDE1714857.1 shikimate dehydrogenase [Chromobacterium amazonense]MDQ4542772.1 shikimate dehydrogenase [Chromobacterium amazonense]OHX18809.1 shikimate dehydrogenase [Chromobacterium amazonense]PRP69701.1 shikimate dehydrogenase [Chromobacterium amazonense]
MTDRYAVIGNPISHSQSPFIHQEFAQATGQDISYEKLFADLGRFKDVVDEFVAHGGKGLNITLPFKSDAYRYAQELTERARAAEAVNTLTFRDGKVYGDNTDGVGLVRDIVENLDYPIQGQRVLILGAGGAVRGVLEPILEQKPASLTIANRTVIKAEALAHHFARYGKVEAVGYDALQGRSFDIIINATSTSLNNEMPPLPRGVFTARTLAYDMVYSSGLTPFLQRAQGENAGMLADGLGMLVEQAAESFAIWRGVQPETRKVTNMLREVLA